MTKYIRSIQRLTAELYNIFLSPLLSIQFFFCSFLHSFIKTIDSLIIFQWNEEENNKKVYLFSKFAVIDVYITSSFYLMSSGSKVTVAVWIGIRYRLLTSQNSSLMLAIYICRTRTHNCPPTINILPKLCSREFRNQFENRCFCKNYIYSLVGKQTAKHINPV